MIKHDVLHDWNKLPSHIVQASGRWVENGNGERCIRKASNTFLLLLIMLTVKIPSEYK